MTHQSSVEGDRGSVTLEVAVLAPALIALLGLAIGVGRYEVAAGAVDAASAAAARAASLARSPVAAQQAATLAARASLTGSDVPCTGLTVTTDTGGFRRPTPSPAGPPAEVAATLTCRVDLGALMPGLPGSRTVTSRATSVLDTYRATT
jgi:Flp pilus assembly protein TadG